MNSMQAKFFSVSDPMTFLDIVAWIGGLGWPLGGIRRAGWAAQVVVKDSLGGRVDCWPRSP